MFILVTGGAGFIGSHTVDLLLAQGARVRVLDNLETGQRRNLPTREALEFRQGDIRVAADVVSAMEGITHVLQLAAKVSVQASVEEPVASGATNVAGFLNVLDAARRCGVSRFVYASSAAVYGVPAELPLTERSSVAPQSPYGLEKLIDDHYAALYGELYGLSTLGLRYFNVYGPRQDPSSPYAGVISRFADRLRGNQPLTVFGDGQQTRDFIYVGDVARANVSALTRSCTGVCNVATGSSVTLLDLIRTLGEASGVDAQVLHEPAREGDILESAADTTRLREELGVVAATRLLPGLRHLLHAQGSPTS